MPVAEVRVRWPDHLGDLAIAIYREISNSLDKKYLQRISLPTNDNHKTSHNCNDPWHPNKGQSQIFRTNIMCITKSIYPLKYRPPLVHQTAYYRQSMWPIQLLYFIEISELKRVFLDPRQWIEIRSLLRVSVLGGEGGA